MIKIRVSYNKPDELKKVLEILKPIVSSYRISKTPNGANKRAYIDIKSIEKKDNRVYNMDTDK